MKKLLIVLFFGICIILDAEVISYTFPQIDTLNLEPFATFSDSVINESSGIIKSRNYDTLFWTLNDSGDEARIFPITGKGEAIKPEFIDTFNGLQIPDAVNIDWEDLAVDENGDIIIGACGNNFNVRRDLSIYIIKEPHPMAQAQTRVFKKIFFYYPEQDSFPKKTDFNYDCEAVFSAENDIFFLTKHRSNINTYLYKLEDQDPSKYHPLKRIAEIEINGMVTAADCSKDGKKLAVLTYYGVFLFERKGEENWFKGKAKWLPIKAKQCEGICFDGDDLIITNEQMELFRIQEKQLQEIIVEVK